MVKTHTYTDREIQGIEEQLRQEQVTIKKFKEYSEQVSDHEVREVLEDLAAKHEEHYEVLVAHLDQAPSDD